MDAGELTKALDGAGLSNVSQAEVRAMMRYADPRSPDAITFEAFCKIVRDGTAATAIQKAMRSRHAAAAGSAATAATGSAASAAAASPPTAKGASADPPSADTAPAAGGGATPLAEQPYAPEHSAAATAAVDTRAVSGKLKRAIASSTSKLLTCARSAPPRSPPLTHTHTHARARSPSSLDPRRRSHLPLTHLRTRTPT